MKITDMAIEFAAAFKRHDLLIDYDSEEMLAHLKHDVSPLDLFVAVAEAVRWVLSVDTVNLNTLKIWQAKIPSVNPDSELIANTEINVGFWRDPDSHDGFTVPVDLEFEPDGPSLNIWLVQPTFVDVEAILYGLLQALSLPTIGENNVDHKSRRGLPTKP